VSAADDRALEAEGWTPHGSADWLLTPQAAADVTGYTTRSLRDFERLGLPSRGAGRTKRYPWTDLRDWTYAHGVRMLTPGARATFIDIRIARAEYALCCARENAAAQKWYADHRARGLPITGDEEDDT
jgi:hypothetical protein